MESIDNFMDLLEDGKYHTIYELIGKSNLPRGKFQSLLMFLREYNFIMFGPAYRRIVKMNPLMHEFWQKIKQIEKQP